MPTRSAPPIRRRLVLELRRHLRLPLAAGSWLALAATALASAESPPPSDAATQVTQGPWGHLVATRIMIEPPDEFLANDYSTPGPVVWIFPHSTPDRLAALWRQAGLDEAQQQELTAATQSDGAALRVLPPARLVLDLPIAARTKIYSELAAFAENPDQQEPFRFRADQATEWFEDSGLAPATVALVRPLLYRRGTSLLFSDSDVVLPLIPARTERLKLVKTLARKATMLVQLEVRPESDVDALAAYWARGPRRKDVRALLQSLVHRPGSTRIDIAHLLPRFPRARLFTYPTASDHAGDANYDCHWTSLNFFNDTPDDRLANTDFVEDTLNRAYAPVSGDPQFGDVLVFFRADGKAIHSCVYIADRIVFTKNGASQVMPWILMDLRDVVAFYPSEPPLQVRIFRRKEL